MARSCSLRWSQIVVAGAALVSVLSVVTLLNESNFVTQIYFSESSKRAMNLEDEPAAKHVMERNKNEPLFQAPCDPKSKATWIECSPTSGNDGPIIDVVLAVYKRKNLRAQLDMIASQTLRPSHVWIIQTENHQDVNPIIKAWKSPANATTTRRPELHLIQFIDSDSKYHGRFHVAYMMSKARYVSIWDDDLSVGKGWLQHVVQFLQSQNDAGVVSSDGRFVLALPHVANGWKLEYDWKKATANASDILRWSGGRAIRVDFTVQHHTLRRELLRFYLGLLVQTYFTGEDIQLSWALKQHGIQAYALSTGSSNPGEWASGDIEQMGSHGPHASYIHKPQAPRHWLLCKVAVSFPELFRKCQNCYNLTAAQDCMSHYEERGIKATT